jgi:hypothetical protein
MGIAMKSFYSKTSILLEHKQYLNNQVSDTGSDEPLVLILKIYQVN